MSDDRLRELERAARASKDPASEARLLRELLRTGFVARERLELAARLGHEPAAMAVDRAVPASPATQEELAQWLRDLASERPLAFRAGVAGARLVLRVWRTRFDGPNDLLVAVCEALEAWILDPSEPRAAAVDAAVRTAIEDQGPYGWGNAAGVLELGRAVRDAENLVAYLDGAFGSFAYVFSHERLIDAVRAEVVPWLLGREDALVRRPTLTGKRLGHEPDIVRRVVPSSDGRVVLASSRRLALIDVATATLVRATPHLAADLYAAALSPDGRRIVAGGLHAPVMVVDAATGATERTFEPECESVHDLAFVPGGGAVLAACGDGTVRRFDLETGAAEVAFRGHERTVVSIAVGDGIVATGSSDATVRIWDLASGRERHLVRAASTVQGIALSGRTLVYASERLAVVLDADSGRELRRLEGHEREVYAVAIAPDGTIASAGAEPTIRFWRPDGEEPYRTLEPSSLVFAIAFAPAGLVAGERGGGVRLWSP